MGNMLTTFVLSPFAFNPIFGDIRIGGSQTIAQPVLNGHAILLISNTLLQCCDQHLNRALPIAFMRSESDINRRCRRTNATRDVLFPILYADSFHYHYWVTTGIPVVNQYEIYQTLLGRINLAVPAVNATTIRVSRATSHKRLLRGGLRHDLGFLVSHFWLLS